MKKIIMCDNKERGYKRYHLINDNGILVEIELRKQLNGEWNCMSTNSLTREFILYIESLLRGLNGKN